MTTAQDGSGQIDEDEFFFVLEYLQLSVRVLSEDAADSINCNSQTFVVRGKSPMFTPTAECPV